MNAIEKLKESAEHCSQMYTFMNKVDSSDYEEVIYAVRPTKDISLYKNLVGSLYTKEFFVTSTDDVRVDGDIYELHEMMCNRFDVGSDTLIGFISITQSKSFVKEARIDAALYPEFVGKGYMKKFMPAISNMARASGFAVLAATTCMRRRSSMEDCGYCFIEEFEEGRGYFELVLVDNLQFV